jgi:predicted RND superfamily exporter protein
MPFALFYTLAAIVVARRIWRRYPPEDGYAAGIVMSLFVSLAFAVGAIILGEQWNWFVEGHRIGNNHMSYRVWRMFWPKHRLELFVAGLLIFWLAAINAARRIRVETVN